MLSRASRTAFRAMRTRQPAARSFLSRPQVAYFSLSSEDIATQEKAIADELALSPKVQSLLDQILTLNMLEVAELSHAIQVRCCCFRC